MDEIDTGLEIISRLAELAEDFGNLQLIVAIHQLLAIEVEEDFCCVSCQRKAEWWHREILRFLAQYQREFPEMGAVAKVNHPMPGLIQ